MQLKTTYKETVGRYVWVKRLSILGIAGSGLVFAYMSPLGGFFTLLLSYMVFNTLTLREAYIDAVHRLRNVTDLRLRLIQLHDNEYALENLAKDNIWRGEPVDPEITERLEEIRKEKQEFQNVMDQFLTKLIDGITPPPSDDKKAN